MIAAQEMLHVGYVATQFYNEFIRSEQPYPHIKPFTLIQHVQKGDEQAIAQFYETFAAPIIHGFLERHPADFNEEVYGKSQFKILYTHIGNFRGDTEMAEGRDIIEQQRNIVTAWCKSIVTHDWIDESRKAFRDQNPQLYLDRVPLPEIEPENAITSEKLKVMLSEMLPEILDEEEYEIISLRMSESTNQEIFSLALSNRYSTVEAVEQKALATITKVEETIFRPAGVRKLSEWAEFYSINLSNLQSAYKKGSFEAIILFDPQDGFAMNAYATEDMLRPYLLRRSYIDPSLIEQGYIPVSNLPECKTLYNAENRQLLHVDQRGKRIYIHTDKLDEWRESKRKKPEVKTIQELPEEKLPEKQKIAKEYVIFDQSKIKTVIIPNNTELQLMPNDELEQIPSEELTTFGSALRAFRLRVGVEQKELAEIMDIDPRNLRRYESGEAYPRDQTTFLRSLWKLQINEAEGLQLIELSEKRIFDIRGLPVIICMKNNLPEISVDEFNSYGSLLRTLRQRVGLSRQELAQNIGQNRSQIYDYESGIAKPQYANSVLKIIETVCNTREEAMKLLELSGHLPAFSLYTQKKRRLDIRGLTVTIANNIQQVEELSLDTYTEFGLLVKVMRQRQGITQNELMKFVGLHGIQVHRIEKNESIPRYKTVLKIIEALCCTETEAEKLLELSRYLPTDFDTLETRDIHIGKLAVKLAINNETLPDLPLEVYPNFGSFLQALRERVGLSRPEFAHYIEKARDYIWKTEVRGTRIQDMTSILKIIKRTCRSEEEAKKLLDLYGYSYEDEVA